MSANGKLIVKPEYLNLVPRPSKEELEALKTSLINEGYFKEFPLITNRNHEILDGHSRYSLCIELNIDYHYVVKDFEDEFDEKTFIINSAKNRRHLNPGQRALLGKSLIAIEEEKAKLRMLSSQNNHTGQKLKQSSCDEIGSAGRTLEKVANELKVGKGTLYQAEVVSKENPELAQKVLQGKLRLNKAFMRVSREKREREIQEKIANISVEQEKNDNLFSLYHGNFREVGKDIPNESVSLIFTDPIYTQDHLGDYEDVAQLAKRVLKPGGNCLIYTTQEFIPDVIARMLKHLTYFWLVCIKFTSNEFRKYSIRFDKKIFVEWKPLLWFTKGQSRICNSSNQSCSDFVTATQEKDFHMFQQSLVEAEYYIRHLTNPDDIVLDPMVGTGTTGVAAVRNARKFIGIDIDPVMLDKAKLRLNEEIKRLKETAQ